jgi:hypothetical protein
LIHVGVVVQRERRVAGQAVLVEVGDDARLDRAALRAARDHDPEVADSGAHAHDVNELRPAQGRGDPDPAWVLRIAIPRDELRPACGRRLVQSETLESDPGSMLG